MNHILYFIADELLRFAKSFSCLTNLMEALNGKTLLIKYSSVEVGRTIELQVLDIEEGSVQVAAFSDGPAGTVGFSACYHSEGVDITSAPEVYINGVPSGGIPGVEGHY